MLARAFKVLILLLVVMSPASAAVLNWGGWAGNSGNLWDQGISVGGNWGGGVPPANGDDLVFNTCQGWEFNGIGAVIWDLNITPANIYVGALCDGISLEATTGNWIKASSAIDIDVTAYLSTYSITAPTLSFDPALAATPLPFNPALYSKIATKGDVKINPGENWEFIDLDLNYGQTLENDGALTLCNIFPYTSYATTSSSGTIQMIQEDRCVNAPAVCGIAGEVNASGFETASGVTSSKIPFSSNLKLKVNSRGTVDGACNITSNDGQYFKDLSLVFYENTNLGSVRTTPNFDVDYDGNYTAYCSGGLSVNTSIVCNDTYGFVVDRSEYPEQKGLTTGAVLLFSILFAALFTGIGLMINSTPMKILMYMFGISAGIMGINYSHLALREWVKVPALIGVVETFAFLANWAYYFIIAILLVMIIVWAFNSLNDDTEDDIEFMN